MGVEVARGCIFGIAAHANEREQGWTAMQSPTAPQIAHTRMSVDGGKLHADAVEFRIMEGVGGLRRSVWIVRMTQLSCYHR